jgi:hypothetical protein
MDWTTKSSGNKLSQSASDLLRARRYFVDKEGKEPRDDTVSSVETIALPR